MPRYHVTLTDTEIQELKSLIQKGGKGYRIKHAQILLKLDQKPENSSWTYDRIKEAPFFYKPRFNFVFFITLQTVLSVM